VRGSPDIAPGSERPDPPDEIIVEALASRLVRPVTVVGVGSDLRGDDAFGVEVARALLAEGAPAGAAVFDAGVVPENYAERIALASPQTVLVADAARFDGAAGELKVLDPEELGWQTVGTHAPSLELLADYLARRCGAKTVLLACQPGANALGEAMSEVVRGAVARAVAALRRALTAG